MGRAIISPDTLEKRRHYGVTGSKQTDILVYVRVKEGCKKGVSVCRVLKSEFFMFNKYNYKY